MSSIQKAVLEVLELELKPDVDKAQKYLELLEGAGIDGALPERIRLFIKQQLKAADLKSQASDAASQASRTWSEIRSAATKHDDLVDKAQKAAFKKSQAMTAADRAKDYLETHHPLVLKLIESEPDADELQSLQTTSESPDIVTLAMVAKATIGLAKEKIVAEAIQIPLRLAMVEFLERIHRKDDNAKVALRAAYNGLPVRDIVRAVDPEVLDVLSGAKAPEQAPVDVLWAAILIASHWDRDITTPACLGQIAQCYGSKKDAKAAAPAEPEGDEDNDDGEPTGFVAVLMVEDPKSSEFKEALIDADDEDLTAALGRMAEANEDLTALEEDDRKAIKLIAAELRKRNVVIVDNEITALVRAAEHEPRPESKPEAPAAPVYEDEGIGEELIPSKPEAAATPEEAAFAAGVEAAKAGASGKANPYRKQAERLAWAKGWASVKPEGGG